ncbi:MAG: ATP synthase F1 subunit gamma [Myxococcales bacterium]|nr:ATP synthase F1 subunit gamma [Myxococcales bacterium]
MPSLKSIRTRIGSVKNTRKITRAMKLVAAARLRRAQEAITAARPYTMTLTQVVSELVAVAGEAAHPLFVKPTVAEGKKERVHILVLSSDRGLAGAFNTNVIKRVELLMRTELANCDVTLLAIGKKANGYFARRNANIGSFDAAPQSANALQASRELATRISADFLAGNVDRVIFVYNEFHSAISQVVQHKQLLPIVPEVVAAAKGDAPAAPAHGSDGASGAGVDYLYEPGKTELLARLAPLYVQIVLYRAILESIASEFGSRMSSMESATKNAGEMISKLTLQYNRARQASITKELLEIIGGAEALKG